MAIRNDGAEPPLQGRSLRAARTQCSSSEPTILQPFDQFERDCCSAGFRPLMSESGHFRQIDPLPTLSACPLRSDRVRTFAPQRIDAVCQHETLVCGGDTEGRSAARLGGVTQSGRSATFTMGLLFLQPSRRRCSSSQQRNSFWTNEFMKTPPILSRSPFESVVLSRISNVCSVRRATIGFVTPCSSAFLTSNSERICGGWSAGTPAVLQRAVGCTAHPRSPWSAPLGPDRLRLVI
jgi:hypothetical protein